MEDETDSRTCLNITSLQTISVRYHHEREWLLRNIILYIPKPLVQELAASLRFYLASYPLSNRGRWEKIWPSLLLWTLSITIGTIRWYHHRRKPVVLVLDHIIRYIVFNCIQLSLLQSKARFCHWQGSSSNECATVYTTTTMYVPLGSTSKINPIAIHLMLFLIG